MLIKRYEVRARFWPRGDRHRVDFIATRYWTLRGAKRAAKTRHGFFSDYLVGKRAVVIIDLRSDIEVARVVK